MLPDFHNKFVQSNISDIDPIFTTQEKKVDIQRKNKFVF